MVKRIRLIHWKQSEAEERAEQLRGAGYEVDLHWDCRDNGFLKQLRASPPAAVVIDLRRLPSHGSAVGTALRQHTATRLVPLVFVQGDEEKTERVRQLLPDAAYCGWSRIRGTLKRVLKNPPVDPVVPDTMAGYTGTPLPKKLGIRDACRIVSWGEPPEFEQQLGELPPGVTWRRRARGRSQGDVVLLFVDSRARLQDQFEAARRSMADQGRMWIIWPKKASPLAGDLSQNDVRQFGLERDLVDYKICSVDQNWSGLCFAHRRQE